MSTDMITNSLGLRPLDEVLAETRANNQGLIITEDGEVLPDISVPTPPMTASQDELIADIETSRKNVSDLIEAGTDSLVELMAVAKSSQDAKSFEAVATLMKTMLEANRDFVNVSEKRKYAKDDHPVHQNETNITNNNLIIPTSELLKMIRGDQ